jgi:hypothetical protein
MAVPAPEIVEGCVDGCVDGRVEPPADRLEQAPQTSARATIVAAAPSVIFFGIGFITRSSESHRKRSGEYDGADGTTEEWPMTPMSAAIVATSPGLQAIWSIVGLFIWILVLVWIYNIAKRKGRHAFGWLVLGIFFSLITLIVVLLLPSKVTTARYDS